MKPSRHELIRRLFALGLLAFVLVGGLGPLLIDEYLARTPTAYAEASNRHIVRITTNTPLFDRPLLVIERATISLMTDQALGDEEIAAKLKDGTANLVVDDAKVLLDGTGLHPARTEHVAETLQPILRALTETSFASLTLRDAKLMAQPASGGGDSLFALLSCEITKSGHDQLRAKGTLERGGISVPFEISLNAKASRLSDGRLPITIKSSGELMNVSITGEYVRGAAVKIEASQATVHAPRAKALIQWLSGAPIAGNGLDDVRISGRLEWLDETVAFQDAKFSIDGNQASGALSVSVTGDRPMLDGTLAFDNLEIAPYVSPPRSLAGLTQNALDWTRWLVGGPTSSLIRDLDADLRLSASSVTSSGAALGRGAASVTVKKGKLLADIAEVELDHSVQGNARISVDLASGTPRYEMRGMLEAPDLANVIDDVTDHQILSGAGRITADIATSGVTESELRSALAGSATVSMPEGGRLAFDIPSLIDAAKSGGLGWDRVISGSTTLDTLDAKLRAANGVVTATGVQAQTATRSLQLDGTIDLTKKEVDVAIKTGPRDTASSAVGEKFRIRGPLLAPAIKIEPPSKAALSLPSDIE